MTLTILNPKFIDDGAGGFDDWTVGLNGAWQPADLGTDDHGATGTYLSPPVGPTGNYIYQAGVFPDFGTSTNHRVTIVVNQYTGGTGVKVRFGTTLVGTITAAGTFTYTGAAAGDDTLSLEITTGTIVEIDHVEAADVLKVAGPQSFMPAYNPNVWYFDALNKAQPGFRYVVEVLNVSNVVIATYRYVPAITTGYAVVDLTRVLQDFVSFDDTTSGVQKVPNSWYGYYLKVYEEFSVPFVYDDYVNPSDDLTALQATTNTHTFNVGDQVTVAQTDGGALKPMLQGLHTVIAPTVAGTSDLYIDVPWSTVGAGAPMGGSVIYADNRKTISGVQHTSDLHYIFNGALPFLNFPSWNEDDYIMDAASSTTKFLSSIPRTFYVTPDQDIRLNFANWFSDTTKVLYFENDGGDKFSVTTATVMTAEAVISASVGPTTTMGTTLAGTAPLIKPTTQYYDVWVVNGTTQYSEKIRFYIDRRCKINDFEIKFLDRMGSMPSFAFQLRESVVGNNEKATFKKLAGGLGVDAKGNPGFTYESSAFGEQVYNVDFKEGVTLTTNYMNDAASVYFKELVSNPMSFLKVSDGVYAAVIVTTQSQKIERIKNTRMIKYTVEVRYANNDNINI